MSNTFKRVLSLLLVLVMIFSVFSVTIFAASNAEYGSAAAGSTATQPDKDNSASGSGSATAGGSFSTDWIKVSYDENNNVTVTIVPTKEGLLSMSVGDLKTLLSFIVEAVKKVVLEDLMTVSPKEDAVPLASYDNSMWYDALNTFLDSEYKGYETRDDQYLAFLKDVVGDEKKVEVP